MYYFRNGSLSQKSRAPAPLTGPRNPPISGLFPDAPSSCSYTTALFLPMSASFCSFPHRSLHLVASTEGAQEVLPQWRQRENERSCAPSQDRTLMWSNQPVIAHNVDVNNENSWAKFCHNNKTVIWKDDRKFYLPNVIHCPEESESNFKLGITFGSLKKA